MMCITPRLQRMMRHDVSSPPLPLHPLFPWLHVTEVLVDRRRVPTRQRATATQSSGSQRLSPHLKPVAVSPVGGFRSTYGLRHAHEVL